jgi:hypothetical protein
MTEKSGQNQTGRFQKGMSGNPSGKPKGARARVTQLAEKLLDDDRDAIVRTVIAAAKGGDPTAMRLCMDELEDKEAMLRDIEAGKISLGNPWENRHGDLRRRIVELKSMIEKDANRP